MAAGTRAGGPILPERHLASGLSALVAAEMVNLDRVGGELDGSGQSNLLEGCHAQALVGVFEMAGHHTRYRDAVPTDRIRRHVERLDDLPPEDPEALISASIMNGI